MGERGALVDGTVVYPTALAISKQVSYAEMADKASRDRKGDISSFFRVPTRLIPLHMMLMAFEPQEIVILVSGMLS